MAPELFGAGNADADGLLEYTQQVAARQRQPLEIAVRYSR
jgi:hypothetical protein